MVLLYRVMSLGANAHAVYDALIALLDTIEREQDPVQRLDLYQYLTRLYADRVLAARNAAAYEARKQYTIDEICGHAEIDYKSVYYYAAQHQQKTGAPPLPKHTGLDVSRAVDISDRVRALASSGEDEPAVPQPHLRLLRGSPGTDEVTE